MGAVILVEGVRDAESLRRAGVKGRIVAVKAGSLGLRELALRIAETVEDREVVVLVDFDRAGVRLAEKLSRMLEAWGVHVNLDIWLKLRALMGRQVKDVEGLTSYLENVKRKLPLLLVESSLQGEPAERSP